MARTGTGQKTVRRQLFLDFLPDEFDRQTCIDISSRLGMPLSTAERNIKKWTKEGLLERMDLGRYKSGVNVNSRVCELYICRFIPKNQ